MLVGGKLIAEMGQLKGAPLSCLQLLNALAFPAPPSLGWAGLRLSTGRIPRVLPGPSAGLLTQMVLAWAPPLPAFGPEGEPG